MSKTVVPLSTVATITSGKRPTRISKERTASLSVPVIGGGGPSGFTETPLYYGDVLITGRVGTLGKLFAPPMPCWPSDNALVIQPKSEKTNPKFLRYALQLRIAEAVGMNRGAANPLITQRDLGTLLIYHPHPDEQQAIADILGSLDDKIELNQRMNETLEAMAQAIFRDWFVDFGPTRRKLAGITDPVEIMGGLVQDAARAAELAALFPEVLADNGLPEGWEEKSLDQIATFLNGLALQKFPATDEHNSLPVIKIAELRNGLGERTGRADRNIPSKYIVRDGDFLFSWSGSLMAKFWTGGEGALNQHLFKVFSEDYPRWFYSAWVHYHMPEFQAIAASKATTMGHIQRSHLSSAKVVCPPSRVLNFMSCIMEPLVDLCISRQLENRSLAATRDLLLPKLMSGEIRLREAQEIAEAVP